jgi:hypothetical protein
MCEADVQQQTDGVRVCCGHSERRVCGPPHLLVLLHPEVWSSSAAHSERCDDSAVRPDRSSLEA